MREKFFALSAIGALASVAAADVVSYDAQFATKKTNWSDSITLPLFDPSLGTLNKVSWTLWGEVAGTARFESEDSGPADITMKLSATLTLFGPDASVLQITIPFFQLVETVTAYDGITDFGGTSGRTYTGLQADKAESGETIAPGQLAQFTGVGDLILPLTAEGSSTATGAGNIISAFSTFAAAKATISYEYTPVPAPGALALAGLGGLVLARRRR